MFTRLKQFTLVATLGILLSVAFAGTAVATPQGNFAVSSTRIVVGESITVTDTSTGTEGYEVSYEWAKTGYPNFDVRAGSPECLNANCSQAQWTYSSSGTYQINEQLTWPGCSSMQGTCTGASNAVVVVDPADAPAPIILDSPTTVSLPTVLDVASPKPHLRFGGCIQPALHGSEAEFCEPYLIKRVGPDAGGLYHYRFRFPMANPGVVELTFVAWNTNPEHADGQTFTLNVTGNAYRFGDVRSCYWRKALNSEGKPVQFGNRPVESVYDLYFYSVMDSRVVAKLQVRQNGRWVTRKTREGLFSTHLAAGQRVYSPWNRKHMRIHFDPPGNDRRITYEIKHGRKLLKRGNLSKQACTVP